MTEVSKYFPLKVDAEGDIYLPSGEYAASLYPPKELGDGGGRYTPAEKEWIRKMGRELTRRVNAYDKLVGFIRSLTDATGRYPFLDGTPVVSAAYDILAEVEGK